jgi:hypothetical protein
MAYRLEVMKRLEVPPDFYIGHLIGTNIRVIQKWSGAEIIIPKGKNHEIIEIRGSPHAVKLAVKLVQAVFHHIDPSLVNEGYLSSIVIFNKY